MATTDIGTLRDLLVKLGLTYDAATLLVMSLNDEEVVIENGEKRPTFTGWMKQMIASVGLYQTVDAGLAAVEEGGFFTVPGSEVDINSDGTADLVDDSAPFVIGYRKLNGEAVSTGRIASSKYVNRLQYGVSADNKIIIPDLEPGTIAGHSSDDDEDDGDTAGFGQPSQYLEAYRVRSSDYITVTGYVEVNNKWSNTCYVFFYDPYFNTLNRQTINSGDSQIYAHNGFVKIVVKRSKGDAPSTISSSISVTTGYEIYNDYAYSHLVEFEYGRLETKSNNDHFVGYLQVDDGYVSTKNYLPLSGSALISFPDIDDVSSCVVLLYDKYKEYIGEVVFPSLSNGATIKHRGYFKITASNSNGNELNWFDLNVSIKVGRQTDIDSVVMHVESISDRFVGYRKELALNLMLGASIDSETGRTKYQLSWKNTRGRTGSYIESCGKVEVSNSHYDAVYLFLYDTQFNYLRRETVASGTSIYDNYGYIRLALVVNSDDDGSWKNNVQAWTYTDIGSSSVAIAAQSYSRMEYTAHRGLFLDPDVPENTQHSVLMAKNAGFPRIELDVQVTSDGVFVIHHDASINRMMRIKGTQESIPTTVTINKTDFSTLRNSYEMVSGRKAFRTPIPTLQDMLIYSRRIGVIPMLDIKLSDEYAIPAYTLAHEMCGDNFIVFSPSKNAIQNIRNSGFNGLCLLNADPSTEDTQSFLSSMRGWVGASTMKQNKVTKEVCDLFIKNGWEIQASKWDSKYQIDAYNNRVTMWLGNNEIDMAEYGQKFVRNDDQWSGFTLTDSTVVDGVVQCSSGQRLRYDFESNSGYDVSEIEIRVSGSVGVNINGVHVADFESDGEFPVVLNQLTFGSTPSIELLARADDVTVYSVFAKTSGFA